MNNMNNENDRSQYEYHYTCQPNDNEALPVSPEPEKPKKNRRGLKITAGILAGALVVGGSFGAGWGVKNYLEQRRGDTQVFMSDRPLAEVETVKVDGARKLTYSEIYKANVESCVSINVSSVGYNFFGQPVKSASSGSGFVITEDGYIVTNYHVIQGGTDVEVTFVDGKIYPAKLVGGDPDYDIAVIKIDPQDTKLRPVVLGETANLSVGDEVVAIGNPLGELTFSMSEGIASCLDREINVGGTPFNMIQTTAAVNSGNSGGPLFNIYGEVVGIVSAKFSTSGSGASVEGLGFAIPIDDVLSMIRDIMENGTVTTRPFMGVKVDDAVRHPELGVPGGAVLVEVTPDGPAHKAGLQENDVITMVGSTIISGADDILSAVNSKTYKAGDVVTITYVRSGQVYTTELTFGSKEAQVEPTSSNMVEEPQDDMEDFFERFFGRNVG